MSARPTPPTAPLDPEDEWMRNLDVEELRRDFRALRKELADGQGTEDVAHLHKIFMWVNVMSLCGLLLSVLPPIVLVPAFLLSFSSFLNWAAVAHHVSHGGFNTNECVAPGTRFCRNRFGLRTIFRRLRDWPDWIHPEAWAFEHNKLHHYALNEDKDPDLVEHNLESLRASKSMPLLFKYAQVAFFMFTWKWFYYAPNTHANLEARKLRKKHGTQTTMLHMVTGSQPAWVDRTAFYASTLAPYAIYKFILLPLPLLILSHVARFHGSRSVSTWAAGAHFNMCLNLLLAELLTNCHSFICIVTNHAGADMYRWRTHCQPLSGAFYLRAVVSSANYAPDGSGSDIVDALHGWLNYQVEHHAFPKLSMLSYQKAMPRVKAIAKKHGIPYVQESVLTRLRKTVDIMVGKRSMRMVPLEWEEHLNRCAVQMQRS